MAYYFLKHMNDLFKNTKYKWLLTIVATAFFMLLSSCGGSSDSTSNKFSAVADTRVTLSDEELESLKSVNLQSSPQFQSQPDLFK